MVPLYRSPLTLVYAALLITVTSGALDAKDKGKSDPPQDQIEVVAHLALPGVLVTRFVPTRHYRRDYLYAETAGGKSITLIDVTNVSRPAVLADAAPSSDGGTLISAAGTAALISDSSSNTGQSVASARTFRIMSFADPAHPTVKQEFLQVSAIERDEKRGLIFLANPQGVWILQEKLAMDPVFEQEWEHMMLDNR